MTNTSLSAHEREVEYARAKLTQDLAFLCSPSTVAGFTDGLKQQALETKDAMWEQLKARAAANPAAMLAIAAGLGWRLVSRPPIASALIGLGLFSLWRTSAGPLDKQSTFFEQSARSLKAQGEELASSAGSVAAQAKDTITVKGAEAWEAARSNMQDWTEEASERFDEARGQAKSAGGAMLDNLRRQQHDLRDEVADTAAAVKERLKDEDTRNALLMGIAGVAVSVAVGIACQKRMTTTDA